METPRFSDYKDANFVLLTRQAISLADKEIESIANNPDTPTFANTVEALEASGAELDKVLGIFYPLLSADADDAMLEAAVEVGRLTSEHGVRTAQNTALFQRLRIVYDNALSLNLDDEQRMLLEKTYMGFKRSGAELQGADKLRFAEIDRRLNELTTLFSRNVKKELATYRVPFSAHQALGLPQWLIDQTAERAKREGSDADHLLSLDQSEYTSFMSDCSDPELRQRVWLMYNGRNRKGQYDNTPLIDEIVSLRLEKARLLGYNTFADYRLARSMAKTPQAVMDMLNSMRQAYAEPLRNELRQLREFAGEDITPSNYAFHAKRLRKKLHDYDPEELRKYLPLNQCVNGVFSLAKTLYGINIEPLPHAETYHPDVRAYNVTDTDGSHLGLLYADFFSRPGRKSPGAWMTEFREANASQRPWVNIVMNFNPPLHADDAHITPDNLRTLLHEFGHALHSLLTRARYSSIAGTNVFRDFVELPSQFNENYLSQPRFLSSFSDIPPQEIERMKASEQFGAAYAATRQLTFGFLDMAWHMLQDTPDQPVEQFEAKALSHVAVFPHTPSTAISPTFSHIFSGGYASGYYSYKWAEMLDADAFAIFEAEDPFSRSTGQRFRRTILEKGGTVSPDRLFRDFAGRNPDPSALLRRDGII